MIPKPVIKVHEMMAKIYLDNRLSRAEYDEHRHDSHEIRKVSLAHRVIKDLATMQHTMEMVPSTSDPGTNPDRMTAIVKVCPDLIIEILSVDLLLDEMDKLSNIPPVGGEYTEPEEEFRIVDR